MNEIFKKRLIAIGILIGAMYLLKSVFNLLLLTFLFTFFFTTIQKWTLRKLPYGISKHSKLWLIFFYLSFISVIGIAGYIITPIVTKQAMEIIKQIGKFHIDDVKSYLPPVLYHSIEHLNIDQYMKTIEDEGVNGIKHVGAFLLELFLSFLLSFFFVSGNAEIKTFIRKFKTSHIGFLYDSYAYFFKNFVNTFGKVLQLQILISFINSILSSICLLLMGFPSVIGLGAMIFFFGLIPVVGVTCSFIPLAIIAFQIGGIVKVLYVIIMILMIHALESYVLNPKLYSMSMKLPVFFTFSVLILSEHFMGVWGLLFGVPLFIFCLDVLGVKASEKKEKKENETKID